MFTGIVQKLGRVIELEKSPDQLRICIDSQFSDVTLGESIAVNGICLTVTEFSTEGRLYFYVSRETLERTCLGALQLGSQVNLERALLASDRISGHLVQGHVDGLAIFVAAIPVGDSYEATFELPENLSRYCVEKGSIALNGVSLTINFIRNHEIRIMLIPHTWQQTSFSQLKPGDRVNVEVDVLAKYMEKLCQPYFKP
jgi:riboflavin synthase